MTEQVHPDAAKGGHPHLITFTVDGETVTTGEPELTPTQIMTLASVDPSNHYLVLVEGRHHESFKDKAAVPIHVHENETFITVSTGPTPVS